MGKTKYLVGTFLATALLISGCSDSETVEETAPAETAQTQKLAGQRLTDDSGVEYTLIDNGDGTETARYDDGRSVTFQRQEDGSLDYLYGAAGLLAGMAAGYYLFHGFSSPAGSWNPATNRYTVSEPLQRRDTPTATGASAGTSSRPSTTANTSTPASSTPNSSTAANSNSKVNLSKESTTPSTAANSSSKVNLSKESTTSSSSAKSGFGGAGARSSAAS